MSSTTPSLPRWPQSPVPFRLGFADFPERRALPRFGNPWHSTQRASQPSSAKALALVTLFQVQVYPTHQSPLFYLGFWEEGPKTTRDPARATRACGAQELAPRPVQTQASLVSTVCWATVTGRKGCCAPGSCWLLKGTVGAFPREALAELNIRLAPEAACGAEYSCFSCVWGVGVG